MHNNRGNQNSGHRQFFPQNNGHRGHPRGQAHGPNNYVNTNYHNNHHHDGYGGSNQDQFYNNVNFHRGSGSGRRSDVQLAQSTKRRGDFDPGMTPPKARANISDRQLNELSVKVANQIKQQQEPVQLSPESVTLSGDILIGHYSDYVKSKALIAKPFMTTLQPHVAPASVVIPSSGFNLPQDNSVFKTPEGYTREIRHMIVRFDPNWFDKGLANAATRNAFAQGQSDMIDIYDEVSKLLGQVISAAKDFYKPYGKIYIICFTNSKNNIDGLAALHACYNGHTIIQMNEDGPAKLGSFDATDEKLAELFARRIGLGITNHGYFVRADQDDKNKVLSPDTAYSFPTQVGTTKQSKKGSRGRGRGKGYRNKK